MYRESGKTKGRKQLNREVKQAQSINQNLEAALNCLVASVHTKLRRISQEELKLAGENSGVPFFEIKDEGDVWILGMEWVIVKDKLTIKDKFNNWRNGHKKTRYIGDTSNA